MRILLIEDEFELAKTIADYLTGENYICEFASNFSEALAKIDLFSYDCILLDIMLPGGDGLKILKELRREKRKDGVIIISAKNSVDDKISGLQIGADDYLAKPFYLPELAARIFSVIRRKYFESADVIKQNEISINLLSRTVHAGGVEVILTRKEFNLLIYFISNKNRVISKVALAQQLSGDFAEMSDNYDFVYTHIKNLKKKLIDAGSNNYLKTVYGTGYKWDV